MVYIPVSCPGEDVPERTLLGIVPVKVATCPASDAEVREMLLPVKVPVRSTVVRRSE
jgi:hypothetical protein